MAKNSDSNKGWGGPFDFNGDGKVTWDEEAFGLMLMQECMKNDTSSPAPYRQKKAAKPIPTIKPVPEIVDDTNYSGLIAEYRSECIAAIVALVILLIPAVFILWAVYASYDPKNSASDFITILFTVAGFIYGGIVFYTCGKSVGDSIEKMELTRERYAENTHNKTSDPE